MSLIKDILKNKPDGQTIFSLTEIQNLSPNYSDQKLNSSLKYLVKRNDLIRITKGLYTLNCNYSKLEFANKFRTPSYISLYTVLQESGIVFQTYSTIFLVSKRSEKKDFDNQTYVYRKIKDKILLNPLGIEVDNGVFKALPERAICPDFPHALNFKYI